MSRKSPIANQAPRAQSDNGLTLRRDLLLGGAAVATTAQQCTPVPEKGRYRITTSGLRLPTSCSRWTKPGVCVRLTRLTVSESAADVGLPQKRKSGGEYFLRKDQTKSVTRSLGGPLPTNEAFRRGRHVPYHP